MGEIASFYGHQLWSHLSFEEAPQGTFSHRCITLHRNTNTHSEEKVRGNKSSPSSAMRLVGENPMVSRRTTEGILEMDVDT